MKECLIRYNEAETLLEEGDFLLFQGQGLISWWIQGFGGGKYSHVGLVSFSRDEQGNKVDCECLEFREFYGSRAVSLRNYVQDHPGIIHVFRPLAQVQVENFDCKSRTITKSTKYYVGRKLTNELRNLTGKHYGYWRIFNLLRYHLPIIRMFPDKGYFEDNLENKLDLPVCSTQLAYLSQKHYVDLVKNRPNWATEPADLSRSPLLNYLFTLMP